MLAGLSTYLGYITFQHLAYLQHVENLAPEKGTIGVSTRWLGIHQHEDYRNTVPNDIVMCSFLAT